METKQVDLDYILESNDLLLMDTSAQDTHFLRDSYGIRKIEDINLDLLNYENGNILKFINLLNDSKLGTIQEVIDEIKIYVEKLGYKISWITKYKEDHRKFLGNQRIKIDRKYVNHKKKDHYDLIDLLRIYHENVYKFYSICKNKKIEIKNKNYELFVQMFEIIDNAINLKKDTAYIYGQEANNKNNHTDEKLCSALIWNSLFSNNRTGILTKDTDFIRLLGVVPKIIGSDEFLPCNQYFRKRIKSNNPHLYILYNDKLCNEISLDYKFENTVEIKNNRDGDNKKLKTQIEAIWKEFIN